MRKIISDAEIKAMAHTIQHSENVGTGFLVDDDATERVKEAIQIIGIGEGVDWSAKIMKKAVQLQGKKYSSDCYIAIKTEDTIYSGIKVSEDANIIVFKDFDEKLIIVNKVDVVEYVTANNLRDLDYQLIGMQEEQQIEEPTGYYFLSGRTVYEDMPCSFQIHKKDFLKGVDIDEIYDDVIEDEYKEFAESILFDIFKADEIQKVLNDIEPDESLTVTPVLKGQFKSKNYASLTTLGCDFRPKYGGMIIKNIKGYLISFCFDDVQEDEQLNKHSTSIPF